MDREWCSAERQVEWARWPCGAANMTLAAGDEVMMRGLEVGSDGAGGLALALALALEGSGLNAGNKGIATLFQRDRPSVSLPVTAIQPSNAFVAGRPYAVKEGANLGRLIANHKNHSQRFEARVKQSSPKTSRSFSLLGPSPAPSLLPGS
ncbi:hypothetical protein BKA56DRAFT_662952 [Ilyonectria sp. MPI-CAGE-AT-0026]|nr:hypothetical protein BKA56DRAFT_662952 [Ilyonectria sp. MPI-CAGE-AT-0026]